MTEIANIPKTNRKRIVIAGGGFAGTRVAKKLLKSGFQIVLLDVNNYYQFQPLLYQVAIAGLEPSSVSFPLRRMFQKKKYDFHFRMGEMKSVDLKTNTLLTTIGTVRYDYLIIASGVNTNFFGNKNIEQNALTLKSVADAILVRNTILENFENAINSHDEARRKLFLNIAIAGGGPSGVELAGALAEMKKYILPKDYPDYDFHKMNIFLFEGSEKILGSMSDRSSSVARRYLEKLSVKVYTGAQVTDYDGEKLVLDNGKSFSSKTLIWTAGVIAPEIPGFNDSAYGHANRLLVDETSKVLHSDNVFAIGDISLMQTSKYPKGHPQTAPVALQQASHLAKNLKLISKGHNPQPFQFFDKGTMASLGRNEAVADLKGHSLKGFLAWITWSMVHLFTLVGGKNKVMVFIDWATNYLVNDPSLRLLIKSKKKQ